MPDKGYEKEICADGVIVYHLHSKSESAFQDWFEDVAAVFAKAREEGKAIRLLYDVREIDAISPMQMHRAQQLAELPLPDDWRVATLTGSSFATNMINLIRSISLLAPGMYERSRVFSDEGEALAWLREEGSAE